MEYLLYNEIDAVAWIYLNRPQVYNSFHRGMALELIHQFHVAEQNPRIRCIVLSGEGKAFCAGQDLQEATDPLGPGLEKIISEHYNPIIRIIRNLNKPVIAAVNGVAAGAGANMALACDIVVASHSASFIQAFSKIGLIPDSGGTFTLPRLIGWNRASALMMTGDKVTATDAMHMGMIYKVFADELFKAEVEKLAIQISAMPTMALVLTKQLLNQSVENNLEQQLDAELKIQMQAGQSEDFKEGMEAFLQKRTAQFKGK